MTTRAKFRCGPEITRRYADGPTGQRVYEFYAISDTSTPENERFTKATPSGRIEVTIDNPAVVFNPGKEYYVDFTEAE